MTRPASVAADRAIGELVVALTPSFVVWPLGRSELLICNAAMRLMPLWAFYLQRRYAAYAALGSSTTVC